MLSLTACRNVGVQVLTNRLSIGNVSGGVELKVGAGVRVRVDA